MMQRFFCSVSLLSLFVMPAMAAGDKVEAKTSDITASRYVCERKVEVPVTYINIGSGDSYAVIYVEGKLVPMSQHVSASGALYVAVDEQDSYRWNTKGDEAYLSYQEAGHTAEEKIILSGCKTVR